MIFDLLSSEVGFMFVAGEGGVLVLQLAHARTRMNIKCPLWLFIKMLTLIASWCCHDITLVIWLFNDV